MKPNVRTVIAACLLAATLLLSSDVFAQNDHRPGCTGINRSLFAAPQSTPNRLLRLPARSDGRIASVLLPRWSADDLPFFCKIEHDWVKHNGRVPLKFRLGSVDYVDWLEGKRKW